MKKISLLVLLSIILIIVVLSGCSSEKSEESSASPSPEAVETTVPSGESNGKFDPPIEITTTTTIKPPVKFPAGEDYDNNVWTRAYLDNYGIVVKHKWTVDEGQYDTKTNLMIASGDLADFFAVNGEQFKQLAEAGQIEDLTAAYANAPESAKMILTEGGDKPLKAATIDGKLMAIPFTVNPKESTPVLWIRMDWLKQVNLPEPKNMDDVLKIAKAFKTQDPDKNGKADTYGFLADNTLYSLKGFMNSHHAYNGIWEKDASGNLVYSSLQPAMKTVLQKLQDLYKAGMIDPEFAVKNFEKASESLVSGQVGMFYGDSSGSAGGIDVQTVRNQNNKADFKAFPLLSVDSEPARPQMNSAVPQYWVVKKGYAHPDAVFKILSFWVDTFYLNASDDIQEKFISSADGNQPWYLSSVMAYRALRNVGIQVAVNQLFSGELKPEDATPAQRSIFDSVKKFEAGDDTKYSLNAAFGKEGGRGIIMDYDKANLFMENEFFTSATPTMAEKMSTLEKIQDQAIIKIITGAPIADFDKFVDDWNASGGAAITKEVNDWYATVK